MANVSKDKQLEEIAREIRNCRTCRKDKIGVAVPGEGSSEAEVVFVGEAPGKTEAETGRPFVGRAGKILREAIRKAGLDDSEVFITSAVKYLPVYVTPKSADIIHGRRHLFKQLEIIKPKIVVLLGNTACQAILDEKFSISEVHGRILNREGIDYLIAYHPAATLHNPRLRPDFLNDFRKLKRLVSGSSRRN